jgi:murein DD-endopeptidase MepM/ murein hydrolase activator NlpD
LSIQLWRWQKNPDDPYITITQAPAWQFLERAMVDVKLMEARLRVACGFPATKTASRILNFIEKENGNFAPILDCDLASAEIACVSVDRSTIPQNPFHLKSREAAQVGAAYQRKDVSIGGYAEPRLIYTAPGFMLGDHIPQGRRSVHIGVDVFVKAGMAVRAPLAAKVLCVENREGHLDYGGMVILSHLTLDQDEFFTLYGHLNPDSIAHLSAGSEISAGECFARLGDQTHNGGWSPHLHFQLALLMDGLSQDWPGVVDPDELPFWTEVFPNPAALMNLSDKKVSYLGINEAQLLEQRKTKFARNLKLSYISPLMFVRGWKHYLFDQNGQPFLDAYNNVPHVGHAHPRIQKVAQDQLARVNSNTRYLHPAQIAFAEKLTQRTPDNLSVCFFVNSGSEANELALRLARAHSGGKDTIVLDEGYHGNTTGAIDISPYKFNRKKWSR